MDKKELKIWNETLLSNIVGMEATIKIATQKIKEHKAMYEIMNGVTVDGKPLPKSKVKFGGLKQYTKNSIRSNK